MDLDRKYLQTEIVIKEIICREDLMVKEGTSGKMEVTIKDLS